MLEMIPESPSPGPGLYYEHGTNTEYPPQPLEDHTVFTYSIVFEESPIRWASRWDHYLYFRGEEN